MEKIEINNAHHIITPSQSSQRSGFWKLLDANFTPTKEGKLTTMWKEYNQDEAIKYNYIDCDSSTHKEWCSHWNKTKTKKMSS